MCPDVVHRDWLRRSVFRVACRPVSALVQRLLKKVLSTRRMRRSVMLRVKPFVLERGAELKRCEEADPLHETATVVTPQRLWLLSRLGLCREVAQVLIEDADELCDLLDADAAVR